MQAKYLRYGYKRHGPVGPALLIVALLLMLAAPLTLAKPDKCDRNPDNAECRTFNIIFGGADTLLQANDNGIPWQMGYAAPPELTIPLYGDRIAAIADHKQPCLLSEPGDCAARLDGEVLVTHELFWRDTPELGFNFWVEKDLVDYQYIVAAEAWADLTEHPWDTGLQDFCVPMQFHSVWMLQYEPTVRRRSKQCRSNTYFEVCEASDAEDQSGVIVEFWAVIWRDDHPDYNKDYPLTPPCP